MSWFWNKHDDLELARFVIHAKDSEAVKTFIDQAIQFSHLPQSDYDFHQIQNDGRKQLIEKIYNALRQHEIEYALNEYHELSGDRQLIRTPEEILDTQRRGTCLDLAILFSAICWHYDLLPILILVEGHALVAVSLTHSLRDWENEERREQQRFWEGQGKLTDSNKLQKMVKREDYLAIECTGFAKSKTLSECEDEKFQRVDGVLSFDQAVELGCKQLTRPLKFALDIAMAYNFWWSKVCQKRLKKETPTRFINNRLTSGENPLLKLYVPLGLIERKPDAQRRPFENASPPEESPFNKPDDQYEVVQKYDGEAFFEKVLKQERSRSQGKRLAIVGDPGGGKTTLLQWIAYWILKERRGLPIWIPLASVYEEWERKDEGWLYHYLSKEWLKNIAGESDKVPVEWQHLFAELLKSGQVWLLLDGANEMAIKSPLMRIKEQLAKGWADSVRVVLNCRLNLWEVEKEALWENFDIYRTLDFSYPDQVHQFINNWFGEGNPEANELQAKLAEENRKRLQDLVKNPLRLALLCRIWKEGLGTLPDTKAEFYQLLVENHYKWKDDSTNEEFEIPEDSKKELNQALGQLARDAIDSKDFRFRLRESSIRKYLKDPNEKFSLFGWALKLGWLLDVGFPTEEERNRGEKVYAFFHPTFQEYFAATVDDNYDFFLPREHRDRPVIYKNNPEKYERYRIFERQWKEVILLWLGRPEEEVSDKQKEEFLKALVEFEDGCGKFYGYQAYFLAAAGIAEFGDYDNSNKTEVVEQIIKLSFGYLNENQRWVPFLNPIAEQAKEVLQETVREKVIAALVRLLDSYIGVFQGEYAYQQIIDILVKIGISNSTAIDLLEQRMESARRKSTPRLAAECLGRIDSASLKAKAINKLEQLIKSTEDRDTRYQVADSLLKIHPGNVIAINVLVQIIESARDESISGWAAESLGKIDSENPKVIAKVIPVLEQLIKSARNRDKFTCLQAADSLGKIQPDNQIAIEALVELIKPSSDGRDVRLWAVESLVQIGIKDFKAVEEKLLKLIEQTEDESSHFVAANTLRRIDSGKQEAIQVLEQIISSAQDEYISCKAADSLVKNNPTHTEADKKLKQLIKSNNEATSCLAANSLVRIDPANQEVFQKLKELIRLTRNESIRRQAVDGLRQVTLNNQLKESLTAWKDYLSDEIYTSNSYQYCEYYKLIWHCAQNLPYPDFYEAWHQQEGVEKTTIPDSQSLNQANLQERLQSAVANEPQLNQTIHLICIDTRKFIDPNNPAAKIYAEMVKQGCSKCDDGTPKTMQDLQVYWDLLTIGSDRTIVLVFYTSSDNPTPGKGTAMPYPYSDTFLTDLSKFEGGICIITDEPFDHIPLKYFTPSQPIADLVEWIGAVCRTGRDSLSGADSL